MKTKGSWIIKSSAGGYWCGNAHFDTQIRKAHIYHWKEAAEEMIDQLHRRKYITDASITLEVIAVIPPQEAKETEAEWIKDYDAGMDVVYVCSNCRASALNDYRGNSVDSRFCPTCGKRMINSTMPKEN